jgi:predicted unusual protein kinase regulating ubiquinone biosynthesis (AarF/ABC1/UbiB family)
MYRRLLIVVLLFWGFFLEFLLLSWVIRLTGRRRNGVWRKRLYRRQAARFKKTALELGGLLIKLGQFLSARVDIMPREYVEELAGLQDQVAPVPYPEVARVLEAELGAPPHAVFALFEEVPEASASLGQVYRAVCHDGTEVAVKVQRPGIEQVVETDFKAIRFLLGLVGRFTSVGNSVDLEAVYGEFTRTTRAELDYRQEGRNMEMFRRNLACFDYLDLPEMRWELSTQRVMTMTFIHGVKITDYQAQEAAGLSRRLLATRLINVYLKMVMEDGFFHADPHPGNVFALPDSRVALVDFGMVGYISPGMQRHLKALFIAVSNRRAGDITRAFVDLHFVRPGADLGRIRQAVTLILDRFYGYTLDEIRNLDLTELGDVILELVREHPFQIPAQVAFLGRAIGTLVGLTTGLDPDINLVHIFLPYARTLAFGEQDPLEVLQKKVLQMGGSLAALPETLQRVINQVEQGDLKVGVSEMVAVARAMREQAASIRRSGLVVYSAALLLAAALLHINHQEVLGGVALGLSLVTFGLGAIRH